MGAVRDLNAWTATLLGGVLLALGLWGFVNPGVLLIFGTNALHNALLILAGLVLVGAGLARHGAFARAANAAVGFAFLALAALGFAGVVLEVLGLERDRVAYASSWMHLSVAFALLAVAYAAGRPRGDAEAPRGRGA